MLSDYLAFTFFPVFSVPEEDIEIVRLYLNCNASRCGAGLAIFSCASELFWRAYSLPVPVPTHVAVGPRFDIEPLLQVVAS